MGCCDILGLENIDGIPLAVILIWYTKNFLQDELHLQKGSVVQKILIPSLACLMDIDRLHIDFPVSDLDFLPQGTILL